MNIRKWFQQPSPTITYDYNAPELTRGLMGGDMPHWQAQTAVPPPQRLYDLNDYPTPFHAVFRRPANILIG